MNEQLLPPLRAIAELLANAAPQTLQHLRSKFPEDAELFKQGYVLGESTSSPDPSSRKLAAIRAFAEAGLNTTEAEAERIIQILTERLKLARKIKLVGSIIASISSVGIISALALGQPSTALVTAIIALISSLSSLIGEHLTQPLIGEAKGGADLLSQTLTAERRARELRLKLLGADFESPADLISFAGVVNELAASIREVTIFGGLRLASLPLSTGET